MRSAWKVRLERWHRYWTAVGVIPRWQLFGVYALVVAAGIFGFTQTHSQSSKIERQANTAKALSAQTRELVIRNGQLIDEVQRQRREVCTDQNGRHDATIKALNRVLADYVKKHPEQAAQVKDSLHSNVLLINALAPVRDCDAITNP